MICSGFCSVFWTNFSNRLFVISSIFTISSTTRPLNLPSFFPTTRSCNRISALNWDTSESVDPTTAAMDGFLEISLGAGWVTSAPITITDLFIINGFFNKAWFTPPSLWFIFKQRLWSTWARRPLLSFSRILVFKTNWVGTLRTVSPRYFSSSLAGPFFAVMTIISWTHPSWNKFSKIAFTCGISSAFAFLYIG